MATTKISAIMMTLRMLLVVISVCSLTDSAPMELTQSTIGAYPSTTKDMPSSGDDAKQWPVPQKPARSTKHTTKLSLQKKPIKDKASWTKVQQIQTAAAIAGAGGKGTKVPYSPPLVSTGYDVEKDKLSRSHPLHTVSGNVLDAGSDILVDNKKNTSNSIAQQSIRQINPTTTTTVDDDDSGKDIDFVSEARTTKADETYATEPPPPALPRTEGHSAAALDVASTSAGVVENPNFNADPMARMSTKTTTSHSDDNADVQDIKSITPAIAKSLPVNASLSPSLSLQPSATPSTTPKMTSTPASTTVVAEPSKLDVGHDGVKITKKKQLFDKHFIAPSTAGHSSSAPATGADNNPRPQSKNKPTPPTKGHGKKLIEVPNGYLGPIMMKEKTFSVSHHGSAKKPKPSIAEQLRDKKLVEIIAPTALMEPTIKVKTSSPAPPEFVAIEREAPPSSPSSTTTTTTSTSTQAPSVAPTSATLKEEEVVTTYFLVTQKSEENRDSVVEAGPALGLKEIYTEALNAMEEASKKNRPTTESPNLSPKDQTENSKVTSLHSTDQTKMGTTTEMANPSSADQMNRGPTAEIALTAQIAIANLSSADQVKHVQSTEVNTSIPLTDQKKEALKEDITKLSSSDLETNQQTILIPNLSAADQMKHGQTAEEEKTLKSEIAIANVSAADQVKHGHSAEAVNTSIPLTEQEKNTLKEEISKLSSSDSKDVDRNDRKVTTQKTEITINNTDHTVHTASTEHALSTEPDSATDPLSETDHIPSTASSLLSSSESHSHRSTLVADHLRPTDAKQLEIRRTTPGITYDHLTSTTGRSIDITEMKEYTEVSRMITKPSKLEDIVDHQLAGSLPTLASTISGHASTTTERSTTTIDLGSPSTTSIPTTNEPITTPPPPIHHDSSAGPTSTVPRTSESSTIPPTSTDTNPTFATITSEPIFPSTTTTQQPLPLKPTHDSERTESKISDIQIEVYDSTVESILASTNFKENPEAFYPSTHVTTKQSPSNMNNVPQERFTQYVVDKANDFATQESKSLAKASGKPEPAAIEIHINVSEGFGNESEDLEFSYRQSDYRKASSSKKPASSNFITLKPFDAAMSQNETSNEAAEEIVVEIIDGNSNSTENSASRENLNVNPIFTFRSDDDAQVELKNVKYYPEEPPKAPAKPTDDFFVPDIAPEPPGVSKPIIDRDSDTIFYISNTEVKVGESLPTTNTYDAQLKRTRLENQFFPADYEERKKAAPQRYEEDIILSPLKNRNSDPLKLVRGPLDISYVGESVMEVEQAPLTTTVPPPVPGSTPDVIIQPAILPEMSIGVPVIGELPPQIELKEIDFMPNFDANKEDSSIQYGGDLIDEGGAMAAAFDMDSYPLGNLGLGQRHDAISSHSVYNHHVNHLKKDELSADLAASSETADASDLLRRSNESANGTIIGERMGNATAYSVMEEPSSGDGEIHFTDLHTLFTACLATLLPLVLSVVMAFGLRHLYRKYQTNSFSVMGHNSSTDPLDAEKATSGSGDGGGDDDDDDNDGDEGAQTPDELRASPLEFGATANTLIIDLCPSGEVQAKAGDGDGRRDCHHGGTVGGVGGGSVPNGRVASNMDDVHCIQTIIPDGVQEENATAFIVNCIPEAQPTAPPQPPPTSPLQSAATAGHTGACVSAGAATAASNPTSATAGTMQCNYSGANGSITTMTLKNNHLIVETEERNDISRNARETKMHYNNSEKDGVFVVEVSRGADSKIMPSSPVDERGDKCPFNLDSNICIDGEKPISSNQEVQVHPPPPESVSTAADIDSTHLHQIDEVDEIEEGPKMSKNANTGLSQSDLSSSSSVDSNKRYSYGNQELYTIEQQDYNTPSPAATRAPHPHAEPSPPQPENHNDDNGHSENGHCMENDPPSAPNSDPILPGDADADSDVNGHSGVESKPKITAALLKQDTVIANDMTNGNGVSHNGNAEDESSPHVSMENLHNGTTPNIKTDSSIVDYGGDTENGFDSIISLPDPPSTEEMKQMNDIILMETNQLDSLPPPPPPAAEIHGHLNGNGTENGDSHSIGSTSTSPMPTPTKAMMAPAPPTITVAAASMPADIPHSNGNCMTGHTTAASTAAVVEVSGSS